MQNPLMICCLVQFVLVNGAVGIVGNLFSFGPHACVSTPETSNWLYIGGFSGSTPCVEQRHRYIKPIFALEEFIIQKELAGNI